ncbi:MAG: nucleoside hydrolase [Atopococcus tabaci]|uniref:Nucleoside hydrolase n=1 Tax=Atopococcus tabaci TaxID=269774 RepID=A0AA43ZS23_9LACT|nr:nucleoside hydrolase [Atopococcus tabaci]
MNVLIDFDNTFFTDNRDVDDGLALIYLLGSLDVNIVGITSTFGNSTLEEVNRCTKLLLEKLGLSHDLFRGGAGECGDYLTDASQWIVEKADEYAGDLSILALGSMSNLAGAWLRDPEVFEKINQLVLMGGKTSPLTFEKQEMLELNFSVDPHAAYITLTKAPRVSIMTGNNCLDLLFTRQQYEEMFAGAEGEIAQMIQKYSDPWFRDNNIEYGIKGFYNWDTLAAAYLVNPDFFDDHIDNYRISINSLSTGSLLAEDHDPTSYVTSKPIQEVELNLPKIAQKENLKEHIYQTWLNVDKK